jgi:mannose-1-phosphate guanylyltransferase
MGDLTAMVLCAGLGTRLRPLTAVLPKPAAPVCGAPLIRWTLSLLGNAGVERVVVNTHHLPEAMARAVRETGREIALPVALSHEPVIAGTGGALREARALLAGSDTLVLVNGDVLFDLDLEAALRAHRSSGALATLVLLPMPAGATHPALELDRGGAVRCLDRGPLGKFGPGGEELTPWRFSGVHILSPALLNRIPAAPFEVDVNRDVYPPLMASGAVRGHVVDGYWNDLGTPGRYLAANRDVLTGRVPYARFGGATPWPVPADLAPLCRAGDARVQHGARLVGPSWLGRDARIAAGAEVGPEAVVCAGAVVPDGAVVRRAVVWPGTVLRPGEVVEDAVAAGEYRVKALPDP